MSRIAELKSKIDALYAERRPGRSDWADWLHENHVFQVADKAHEIAESVGANAELSAAAGMLHDVADSVMSRFADGHAEESDRIGRRLMVECGYSDEEIATVLDDAVENHSCRDGKSPLSLEGKAMATADAVIHLITDFYPNGIRSMSETKTKDELRAWGLPKIERDFRNKIFFDDIREAVRSDYEKAKSLF